MYLPKMALLCHHGMQCLMSLLQNRLKSTPLLLACRCLVCCSILGRSAAVWRHPLQHCRCVSGICCACIMIDAQAVLRCQLCADQACSVHERLLNLAFSEPQTNPCAIPWPACKASVPLSAGQNTCQPTSRNGRLAPAPGLAAQCFLQHPNQLVQLTRLVRRH